MIVSIDTQTVSEISQDSINVSAEVTAAFECLAPVVEHNDWNCRERDTINEMITTIKQFSQELKENAETFSSSLQQTASSFNELENKTPVAMQGFHAAIADNLSIKTPTTVINGMNLEDCIIKNPDLNFICGYPNSRTTPFKAFQIETALNPIFITKPVFPTMIGGDYGKNFPDKRMEELKKTGIDLSKIIDASKLNDMLKAGNKL